MTLVIYIIINKALPIGRYLLYYYNENIPEAVIN